MFTEFRDQRLAVFPCNGKKSVITEWQRFSLKLPEIHESEEWDAHYSKYNIGLALGPASGLIALDIDVNNPETLAKCPPSPLVKRGLKGETRFFLYRSGVVTIKSLRKSHGIEILSQGTYTILPPSIHPDNLKPYEWIGEYKGQWAIYEAQMDKSIPEWDDAFLQYLPDIEGWDQDGIKTNERGRNNELLSQVTAGFFSGKDDLEVAKEIFQYDKNNFVKRLFTDENEFRSFDEDGFINALQFTRNVFSTLVKKHGLQKKIDFEIKIEKDPSKPTFVWAEEIISRPDVEREWLCEDFLFKGGISMSSGEPKVGKSTLFRHQLLCICNGIEFLGHQSKKSKVLYMPMEGDEHETARQIRLFGLTDSNSLRILDDLNLDNFLQAALEESVRLEIDLIVFDTFSEMISGEADVDKASDMRKFFKPIRNFVKSTGKAIHIIHHMRKSNEKDDKNALMNRISGSVTNRAKTDINAVLYKNSSGFINLLKEGRGLRIKEPIQIGYNESEMRPIHEGMVRENIATAKRETLRDRIYDYVRTHSLCSRSDLRKNIKGSPNNLASEIDQMVADGTLHNSGGLYSLSAGSFRL